MTGDSAEIRGTEKVFDVFRRAIGASALVAGGAVLLMIGVTAADIVLRLFGLGIFGAYDIVRAAGAVSVSFALPYLTAVKGHIAIEYFYQRFSRTGRIVLDSFFRIIAVGLFAFLAYRSAAYGLSLYESGQVMPTLKIPMFWIPLLISFDFGLMVVVTFYHLTHPGKEMIKP